MVGHVRAFLEMVNMAFADVLEQLRRNRLWGGLEVHIQDSLYDRIHFIDFSRDVLSAQISRLAALRMGRTGWNDLGIPNV